MIPLFLGITLVNLLCLGAAAAMGYAVSHGRDWGMNHQLFGALATIVCCAAHCIVFTYFIATAKWVQHAVSVKRLDPALTAPTRSFRAQAFPAAVLAMLVVFICAVVGAATFSYHLSPTAHHALAIASLVINVAAAAIEYRAIVRNGELIDHVLDLIRAQPPRVDASP